MKTATTNRNALFVFVLKSKAIWIEACGEIYIAAQRYNQIHKKFQRSELDLRSVVFVYFVTPSQVWLPEEKLTYMNQLLIVFFKTGVKLNKILIYIAIFVIKTNIQKIFDLLRPFGRYVLGFRTVVQYRKIPPASHANQIVQNNRIPPAAYLQKNKCTYFDIFILCL
jgi:hypothetical protein